MKNHIVHGELVKIFIVKKTKLENNSQLQDTQLDLKTV